MNLTVTTYLLYLAITVPLTLSVARALYRHGQVFLVDVFLGDERLAGAVNHLLVIGFYLLNLGFVALFMTSAATIDNSRRVLEVLSGKVGTVAVVLGIVHVANVWAFSAFRRRAMLRAQAMPPVTPNAYTPVMPGSWPAPGVPAR
jgi:hypothetical protein